MNIEEVGRATLQYITLAVMLFGLFGLVIPILPGLVIIWVAALIYGLITGLTWVSGAILGVMTLLMIGGSLIDNIIMGASARQTGASWIAILVAMLAGVAGSFFFPPFGGLIAALIGLFIVEMVRLKNWQQAFDSTRSMALGCGWAVVVRFGIGLLMILMWGAWTLWL